MTAPFSSPYMLRTVRDRYPVQVVHRATGVVVGRYYEASREAAERHCAEYNAGTSKPIRLKEKK